MGMMIKKINIVNTWNILIYKKYNSIINKKGSKIIIK